MIGENSKKKGTKKVARSRGMRHQTDSYTLKLKGGTHFEVSRVEGSDGGGTAFPSEELNKPQR